MEISLRDSHTGRTLELAEHGAYHAIVFVSRSYAEVFPFYKLAGRTGEDTSAELFQAAKRLGTVRDVDYTNPTEGNVGYLCSLLAEWASRHPNGIWEVT